MGLRCSLLGHAYGEPVTERDRERRGDEAVVTTRKIRTCRRCGAETVLSENTEVRYLGGSAAEGGAGSPATKSPTESKSEPEPTAEPKSEPEPTAKLESEPEPTSDTDSTGSQPDVADLVERAEAESSPPGLRDETEGDVSEPVETHESETAASQAPESPEPEPETEADKGIILDDSTDEEPAARDRSDQSRTEKPPLEPTEPAESAEGGTEPAESAEGGSESAEPAAGAHESEPAAGENGPAEPPQGVDAIDDIEDLSESAPSDPTRSAPDSAGAKSADGTDSTAEPGSMSGQGSEQPDTSTAATDADSETQTDPWKERLPAEDTKDSADEPPEWDDPAFQFGLQDESGPSTAESTDAVQRGPSGIKSEGPLEVDSEPDSPTQSLVCPECGFSESSHSSLRAGDICPECHRGYLAGRR